MISSVLIKNPVVGASLSTTPDSPPIYTPLFGLAITIKLSSFVSHPPRIRRPITTASALSQSSPSSPELSMADETVPSPSMKLLFVEMGVGYDQHGYFNSIHSTPTSVYSIMFLLI